MENKVIGNWETEENGRKVQVLINHGLSLPTATSDIKYISSFAFSLSIFTCTHGVWTAITRN